MRTVAVVGMKGGTGKTTLALHLAVATVQQGLNVAVLDLDPQQSAAKWGDRRAAPEPVVLAVAPSRLPLELERVVGAGADVAYLDTPPRAGSDNAAQAAARVADLVLLPCRPAILDLEAIAASVESIRSATAAPHRRGAQRLRQPWPGSRPGGRSARRARRAGLPRPDRSARGVRPVPARRPHRPGSRAGRAGCR